jgi:acetyl esterase
MALDPLIQTMVDQSRAAGRAQSLAGSSVDDARNAYLLMRAIGGDDAPVASVVNGTLPGPAGDIPIRVYTPEGDGPFGVCVYFHGGGFVIGSVDSHDPVTRRLASEAGVIVVSVDYRLAPEHPYPAAVDDAWAALQWIGANAAELGGVPRVLAVAGDSAGGNLAAVVSLLARDAGGPRIAQQLLIYPTTDARLDRGADYPSLVENADAPFLPKATIDWFAKHHRADGDDWRASPILAGDLSGLPPAHVVTAQYDTLRDEGEAYAERLRDAGVPVTVARYPTMPHVFIQMWGVLGAAKECMTELAGVLREAFALHGQGQGSPVERADLTAP